MSKPETLAITGLRTFLGLRIAQRMVARGCRVIGIDLRRPYRLEGRVRFLRVDLTDPGANVRIADVFAREHVEAVLHAAFRSDPTPDVEYDHELETLGSLQVLHACAAAKVRRLVIASSTTCYGARPDNPNFLRESHPLRGHPDAHCVQNRVEMESLVAEWSRRHPAAEVTVLRHGWIMGPTFWNRVVSYFARPAVPMLLGFDPLLQFVHEDDCLDAFEAALLDGPGGVYNVVAPGVLPVSTLLRVAGKRSIPLPTPLLYRLRAFTARARTGDSPAGFYDYLRYLWVADGERGWNAFGAPVYDTREAWMSFVSSRRLRRYR